jgi:hypothetical protein
MRIIKHPSGYQKSVECVVGEMINLEAGSILFKDGVRVPDDAIGARTYPSASLPECEIRVRFGKGTIYANPNNLDKFIAQLQNVYLVMVAQLAGTKYENYRNEYYATEMTPHVKVSRTMDGPVIPPIIYGGTSPKQTYTRFTWNLLCQTSFTFSGEVDISKHMCSIFYDHCDILTLPHDSFVPMLTPKHCVRNPNLLQTPSIITLTTYVVPFLYQYKLTKWRVDMDSEQLTPPYRVPAASQHHALPTVYKYEGSGIQLPASSECIECKHTAVGDHYVLYTTKPTVKVTVVCAPCCHNGYVARRVLNAGTTVFSRGAVITYEKYLEMNEKSPDVRDIYHEAMTNGIVAGKHGAFIGRKYYAVPHLGSYLLGGNTDTIPDGVQVINGVLIH